MRSPVRGALALVTSAPWRRAPLLLWRRPGVLAAVAGGCVVLAASVAAVPLFLSSAGTGAVDVQAAERCPRDTGAVVPRVYPVPGVGVAAAADDPLAAVGDGLGPRAVSFALPAGLAGGTDDGETEVVLLARAGALDHVDVVEGAAGPGLWLSDRGAAAAGLARGDVATIVVDVSAATTRGVPRERRFGRVEVPVAGVYRDLTGRPLGDYWCSHTALLELRGLDPVPPPPLLLLDPATFADVAASVGLGAVAGEWEAPLAVGDVTLADADGVRATLADAVPGARTRLPFVTRRARAIRTAVAGGVLPVAGFGALAGVALVGASASLWHDRRRQEVTLLAVRGVGAGAIGLKAVLELAPALVAGSAAGLGLAAGLVVALGPSPLLEPAAIRSAAVAAALAAIGAAAVVATVAGLRARGVHGPRHVARRLALVPWELLLAGAALVSHRRLGQWGVPVSSGADVTQVDVLGLLFPLLFLVAVVAVTARLLGGALRPLRVVSGGWPPVPFLAVRRVDRYRVAVLGLVAASAVAAGVLGYAATLTRSLNATLDAKARTYIGSDIALGVAADDPIPDALAGSATAVEVYRGVALGADDRETADLLVIDPATFERAAFWDDGFAGRSLGEIVATLAEPADDGRVRAVVVGADAPRTTEVRRRPFSAPIELAPIEGVDAFPGMRPYAPTVVVAAPVVEDAPLRDGVTEVWARGTHEQVRRAYDDAGIAFREARTVGEVVDRASFLTVSWTFGVMQALGVVAAVLVVGGMALYLDARRRGRVLGYAFARRMGLTRAAHRRVLMAELVASVVVGCWLGLAVATVGARVAYGRIDPVPGLAPAPLLRPATGLIAALAVAALGLAAAAAVLAQRRTDRDDPLEVLRAGV